MAYNNNIGAPGRHSQNPPEPHPNSVTVKPGKKVLKRRLESHLPSNTASKTAKGKVAMFSNPEPGKANLLQQMAQKPMMNQRPNIINAAHRRLIGKKKYNASGIS
jgi:hypothetical protein